MENENVYSRYSQAILCDKYHLENISAITKKHICKELEYCLEFFSMEPKDSYNNKDKIQYRYTRKKNNAPNFIFLAYNVITSAKKSVNIWNKANELIKIFHEQKKDSKRDVLQGMLPIAGEYLSFVKSDFRGLSKASLETRGLLTVTTLTPIKPCLSSFPNYNNFCIIPDLNVDEMISFVRLFKKMTIMENTKELYFGKVEEKDKKYYPKRPSIYHGNFPNAPKSSILGGIGLIAAIGEFAKLEETSELAKSVLESLKNSTLYIIKYGDAQPFSVHHYIIDLAKDSVLKTIIDGLYYSKLYNQDRRTYNNTEYQKFDLMTSRFLQLFNRPAFKDFLSFRAEYPEKTEILFNIFFKKMEKIKPEIIESAKAYGRWLNRVAYIAAKNEIGDGATPEKIREAKAKALIELESAAFSAKDGTALIAQTVTRAGRLSYSEAPKEAELFFEKTASEELSLEQSKNLIIAFSRLKNLPEKEVKEEEIKEDDIIFETVN